MDVHLISFIVFLPLGAGLLLVGASALVRSVSGSGSIPGIVWRSVGLAATSVTFGVSGVGLWHRFDPEQTGYQLVERLPWLPEYGIHYFVGIDGISLVLVLLTTFLMPLVILASWREVERSLPSYVFFMLFLETAMLGSFVSLNLFQFYVFWEVMVIPMYFIIGVWGGPRRIYAATKFFLFTLAGSVLMLVALVVVYRLNYEQGAALNFDLVAVPGAPGLSLLETSIATDAGPGVPWWQTQTWLFAAFALAFGIKVPVFPLHTWLPDAHVEAPTGGSVVLAGILLKMGAYGFIRFALPLFPVAAHAFVPLMFTLALIGIIYGSLVAMVQNDVKKLVAYSSIAHLGFVVLGLFALNLQGVTGAVLQMINHGLATGALFILVGFIYGRRHTREISNFGGLAKPMPVFAALFGVVVMASIGLPALGGFVGEFLILLGTFGASPWVAVIGAGGVVLAAAYMLWMYRRVVFGALDKPENRGLIDLDVRERVVAVALIVPLLWIGVHPGPLLRRIEPSVSVMLQDMELREARAAASAGRARSADRETAIAARWTVDRGAP